MKEKIDHIKIDGKETGYAAIPVSTDCIGTNITGNIVYPMLHGHGTTAPIELPQGQYEQVGFVTAHSMDEGCKVMVEHDEYQGIMCYMNYLTGYYEEDFTAEQSIRSLIQHNEIEIKEGGKLIILRNRTNL